METNSLHFGITPSHSPSIVRFLDGELRADAGFSVRDEYPAVFGDYPGGHSLFVKNAQGEVVAHVAYLTRVFTHSLYQFKIGLIGSVATAEPYRGHGIASALLREALMQLKSAGCLFAVLWAENPEFYRPLGFERAGREQALRFSAREIVDEDLSEPVFPFDPRRHTEGIWRLYRQHKVTVDRSLQEFKRLCRIPRARIFITANEETPTSYIVIHKGLDFANYIHEWGGKLENVRANIARVQKQILPERDLTLIAPGDYDLKTLRNLAVQTTPGVLGMVRLLDRARLRAVYLDYLKAIGAKNWMGEEWGGDGRSVPTKTDQEFTRAVLGDDSPSEHPNLPFFLWGMDSI